MVNGWEDGEPLVWAGAMTVVFFFFSFLLVKSQYEVFFQKLYLINWAVDGWEDGEPLSWAIIKTYAFSADLWRSLAD